MKQIIGASIVILGVGILSGLILAIPYVFYIGLHYGWLDDRIAWAPLGIAGSLFGAALAKLGCDIHG